MSAAADIDTAAIVTYESFAHRIPLNRRQWETLNAVPSVRLTAKGRRYYNRGEVVRWILATMAPIAGEGA